MRIIKVRYGDITPDQRDYALKVHDNLNKIYGYDDVYSLTEAEADKAEFFFAIDDKGQVKGIMLLVKHYDVFSGDKGLYQRLLYGDTPRASAALFQHFIDCGKKIGHAVYSVLTPHTNLKESNLLKRGFKKFETVYKLKE